MDVTRPGIIKFLPVCSECGKIINEEIDCVEYYNEENLWYPSTPLDPYVMQRYKIQPDRCKNCGAPMVQIKIPCKLPFKDDDPVRKKETNKEWMTNLPSSSLWRVMDWLLNDFGKKYTNMPEAIIAWLDGEHDENIELARADMPL